MKNASNETVRQNIRYIRISQEMTQEKLAFASGMTTACVSRLERANGNPTIQTLDQIADALKIPTKVLFDEDICSPAGKRRTGLERCFYEALELTAEKQEQLLFLMRDFIGIGKLF